MSSNDKESSGSSESSEVEVPYLDTDPSCKEESDVNYKQDSSKCEESLLEEEESGSSDEDCSMVDSLGVLGGPTLSRETQGISDALASDGDTRISSRKCLNTLNCVECNLKRTDLKLVVEGLGELSLPLSKTQIQELIAISSKAKYGLREKTLLDEKVRDSQQILADKLKVTIEDSAQERLLKKMRVGLGLPDNTALLIPHLHDMLLYGPGQFFDKHQDTEKMKNMIATLVIVLPSPHIGGDLKIENGRKDYIFSTENLSAEHVRCIAFYADCKHQTRKVKDGHRVALTYNLVLKSEDFDKELKVQVNEKLKNAIKTYFEKNHLRLAFFLSHSYSEHGLNWNLLKGTDRKHAVELFAVANELNLARSIGLVKIKEGYSTERRCLENFEISVTYLLDSQNRVLVSDDEGSLYFDCEQVCWTKRNSLFRPTEIDYDGSTGNEGQAIDYWYRRAAIVLWSSEIIMNFATDFQKALNDLVELTKVEGNEDKVIEIINAAILRIHAKVQIDVESFENLTNIALYSKNKDSALKLLSHFDWDLLENGITQLLLELQAEYGDSWCVELIGNWKLVKKCYSHSHRSYRYDMHPPLDDPVTLISKYLALKGRPLTLTLILDFHYSTVIFYEKIEYKYNKAPVKNSKPCSIQNFSNLFVACAVAKNATLMENAVKYLKSKPDLYPVVSLDDILKKIEPSIPSEYFSLFETLGSCRLQHNSVRLLNVETAEESPDGRTPRKRSIAESTEGSKEDDSKKKFKCT